MSEVAGAGKLVDFCGYWPSFLDAVFEGLTVSPEGPAVTGAFVVSDFDPG